MKKLFILIGFMALSTNICAMQEAKQSAIEPVEKIEQKQFTKKDKIKIGAAALGCALCSYISFVTFPLWSDRLHDRLFKEYLGEKGAWYTVGVPVLAWLCISPGLAALLATNDDDDLAKQVGLGTCSFTSGASAILLGIYAYKKLYPKKQKTSD